MEHDSRRSRSLARSDRRDDQKDPARSRSLIRSEAVAKSTSRDSSTSTVKDKSLQYLQCFGQSKESLNKELESESVANKFGKRFRTSSSASKDSGLVDDQRYEQHVDDSFNKDWNEGKKRFLWENNRCANFSVLYLQLRTRIRISKLKLSDSIVFRSFQPR
jgi:phosphoribosylanthranilate isomerase